MKLLRTIFILAVLALVPALAACSGGATGANASGSAKAVPAPGHPAPAISLTSLQGQTVTLASLKGHPVLINFFATWCPYCKAEMGYLQTVYHNAAFQKAGLKLYEIDVQESAGTVQQFMTTHNLDMPVLLDTEAATAEAYNVNGMPTSFFINSNGIIQKVKVGAYGDVNALENDVQALINSQ